MVRSSVARAFCPGRRPLAASRVPGQNARATGRCLQALAALFAGWLGATTLHAAVTVNAALGQSEAFVGEAVLFQIQVQGSEQATRPDLSGIKGFEISFQRGQKNSNRSVSIVNGRMSQQVKLGYVFSYALTPQNAGVLRIPPVSVTVDGQGFMTQPLALKVSKPAETSDFALRLSLSKETIYVGEPVTLTVTWYLGQDVRGFQFSLPLLENKDLFFADPVVDTTRGEFYRLPVGGKDVAGKKGQGALDGKTYTTISFSKVIIPRVSGEVVIEPAQVVCEALIGYRNRQQSRPGALGRDLFNNVFNDDFFGRGRKGIYRKIVIPSNALTLDVSALPREGRPAGFAGHVGSFRVAADASPLDVSVGDPITLNVFLSGPDYLEHIPMPDLNAQASLAQDFKMPAESGAGKVTDAGKLFTQTIRAKHADVDAIPPIELPYFDTTRGAYAIAKSQPIPLKVRAAKVVTAADAEGRNITVVAGQAVEDWAQGIAYNYTGEDLLRDERMGLETMVASPLWLVLLFGAPGLFVVVQIAVTVKRRRDKNPLLYRSRRAHATFTRAIAAAGMQDQAVPAILSALREYLGARLAIPSGAITYRDTHAALEQRGAGDDTLAGLKRLFDDCEIGHFGGSAAAGTQDRLVETALNAVGRLEKELK